MVEAEQKIKVVIKKLQDESEELKDNITRLKSQDEELHDFQKKVEFWKTIKRKWTQALFFHNQQQKALNSQVKALIKEKKEKENVLTYLELVNMKNVYLLQSEKIKRKIIKAKREKLIEDNEYQRNLQQLQAQLEIA